MTDPTTHVLVHGAWHDNSSWTRVAERLTAAGHRVLTPELTGHGTKTDQLGPDVGLDTHVRDVLDALERGNVNNAVLVGHSYAGMVITGVAERAADRISHMVFVDAMVPEDGENTIDVMPVTQLMIDAAATTAEAWKIPPLPELPAPQGLYGITDPEDIAWIGPTLGAESVRCFQDRVHLTNPDAAALDRAHVHCVGDKPDGFSRRPVPPIQANGRPARVFEVETGHDIMVTAPEELTNVLIQIVPGRAVLR